jgi:dCTP deaminase
MLSDYDIREAIKNKQITIDPFDNEAVGPCSIDLKLDSVFRVYNPGPPVDIKSDEPLDRSTNLVNTQREPFMILPGQFILGETFERIRVSSGYAALLEGLSSVARLGIIVHAAGLVNPGTGIKEPGKLTLEIYCENLSPVLLYPGMRIVQIMFVHLTRPASVGYDERDSSKYIGQSGPSIS